MRHSRILVCTAAALLPRLACALEATREGAEKLKGFGLAEGSSTPAFGRIIVVFLLLAALAWAAAWLLRRFSSRWGARFGLGGIGGIGSAGANPLRHVARSSLPGGIACHLVEAQGSRVLITVSRHGVTSLLLGAATPPPPESAP